MPAPIVVGISDCKVSGDQGASIMTYALGSCVGVAFYDSDVKVGGLLHVLLPHCVNNIREDLNPFMFADTGINKMADELIRLGVNPHRLTAKIAGGANMLNSSSVLDIGRKNVHSVMEHLERMRIPIRGSSVGGTLGRSMQLDVGTGKVIVRYLGGGEITL